MLIDEVVIKVQAGRGGDGLVSFWREKFVPKGGPDGGDGGRGGNVYFEVDPNLNSLFDFARLKQFKAQEGEKGKNRRRHGKDGEDLVLKVPLGTMVFDSNPPAGGHKLLYDFDKPKTKVLITKGGEGGLGNVHFISATHQAPREATPGKIGQEKTLRLELKLIAQVGIIGLPNVGKSSLLAAISNARPKIADYPFTTLEPYLGVVNFLGKVFVVADIPGLIEGASKGKGLGDKFLRHIERTKILVHLLDATSQDLKKDYQTIREELKMYSLELLVKPEIIAINKIDLVPDFKPEAKIFKNKPTLISAVTRQGLDLLLKEIIKAISPFKTPS